MVSPNFALRRPSCAYASDAGTGRPPLRGPNATRFSNSEKEDENETEKVRITF